MTRGRRAAAALIPVLLVAGSGGCGGGTHRPPLDALDSGTAVAVYRGTITETGSREHGFRATVFLAEPDRVHVEIAGPVGGPRVIVDGGGGRIALSFVSERIAYVGDDGRDGLRRVLGLDLDLRDLVDAVLDGVPPPSVTRFERVPGGPGGWPRRIEMSATDLELTLDLRRTRGLPAGAGAELGTGTPAPGLDVLPLEQAPSGTLAHPVGENGR